MADENKEEKELAKIGERVATAIEELAKAQKESAEAQKKTAEAQEKEATAEKEEAKAELKEAETEKYDINKNILQKDTLSKWNEGILIFIASASFLLNWFLFKFPTGLAAVMIDVITIILLLGASKNLFSKQLFFYAILVLVIKNFIITPIIGIFPGLDWLLPVSHFFWVIFALFFLGGLDFLLTTKIGLITTLLLIIIFGLPLYQSFIGGTTFEGIEQAKELTENVKSYLKETGEAWIKNVQKMITSFKCTQNPELPECKTLKEEEGRIPIKVYLDSKLPKQFDFAISGHKKEIVFSNQIDRYVSAASNQGNDVEIEFSCGIDDFEKGKIDPNPIQNIEAGKSFESRVVCNLEKKWDKGVKDFYFDVLLKNVQSKSIKELFFMDKKTLDAQEKETLAAQRKLMFKNNQEKNNFLNKEYGTFIQPYLISGQIMTRTSDEFITILIQEDKTASDTKEPSLYVYGVEENMKMPFKLYIQKNKIGDVDKINSIKLDLPKGVKLDCDYNEGLEDINWTKVLKVTGEENQYALKPCNLIFTSDFTITQIPSLKTISATVDYDFKITEKSEVVP